MTKDEIDLVMSCRWVAFRLQQCYGANGTTMWEEMTKSLPRDLAHEITLSILRDPKPLSNKLSPQDLLERIRQRTSPPPPTKRFDIDLND